MLERSILLQTPLVAGTWQKVLKVQLKSVCECVGVFKSRLGRRINQSKRVPGKTLGDGRDSEARGGEARRGPARRYGGAEQVDPRLTPG